MIRKLLKLLRSMFFVGLHYEANMDQATHRKRPTVTGKFLLH